MAVWSISYILNAMKKRCTWAGHDPLYIKYHDEEWAVPVHDDTKLFEFIVLESAQAGLSWITILKKRDGYRKAFNNFDVIKVAKMNKKDVERLMKDDSIVRNRLKIEATIQNAKVFIAIQKEFGSFSDYMWSWVNNQPIENYFKESTEIPSQTELSKKISKDLKKRGMKFFGPTICYAHMQATGLVNDHVADCFRYAEIVNKTPSVGK